MTVQEEIGARIRAARERKGLKVSRLAEVSGFARGYLHQLERGGAKASSAALEKLARLLECTPEFLRGEVDDPGPAPSTKEPELAPDEMSVIQSYRSLMAADKRMVQRIIELAQGAAESQNVVVRGQETEDHVVERQAALLPFEPPPRPVEPMCTVRLVGYVAAGMAWPDEEIQEEIEVPTGLAGPASEAVRVKGYSLVLDGVLDGDILVIDRADWNYHRGQMVVAAVSDAGRWGMVVKKYGGQRKGIVTLKSAHPSQPDIVGRIEEEIQIRAIVRHVWRS